MSKTIRNVSIPTLVMLLAVPALVLAGEVQVPNINKRGTDEKVFAGKLAKAIVTKARTSVKDATVEVEKFEKKEPKAGHTEFHIKANFKGAITKKDYTAKIVIYIDSSDKSRWEVTRITYEDDSRNVVGFNRKNVDALVDRLNGKGIK
jgi:hypothetical protein